MLLQKAYWKPHVSMFLNVVERWANPEGLSPKRNDDKKGRARSPLRAAGTKQNRRNSDAFVRKMARGGLRACPPRVSATCPGVTS